MMREHRLYQADFLMRGYGFQAGELLPEGGGNLALDIDPKLAWALAHRDLFPLDLNLAEPQMIARVPGIGLRNAKRIVELRRSRRIRYVDLARLRCSMDKIAALHRHGGLPAAARHAAVGVATAPDVGSAAADELVPGAAGSGLNHRASATTFADWRRAARTLLAQGVAPHEVDWSMQGEADLFGDDMAACATPDRGPSAALRVSSALMSLLEAAACFRAPDRWALLYRILWRSQQGDATAMSAADADGARLHAMAKAVKREAHKMHAFLRFRERDPAAGDPRFIAWFEPAHDVLPNAAGHFAKRMGRASWLIVTPDGTAASDGETVCFGPAPAGRPAEVDIDDQGEALWLTYYRSIYNPSRLNTGAMEMHMPVRYWKNLPEGRLIPGLISAAGAGARRTGQAQGVGARQGTQVRVEAAQAMPARALPSALVAMPSLRTVAQCDAGGGRRRACQRRVDAGRRAAGRPGRLDRRAVRRAGRQGARPRAAGCRHRPQGGLPDQRRQAFQMGAARQAPHPQDAGAA